MQTVQHRYILLFGGKRTVDRISGSARGGSIGVDEVEREKYLPDEEFGVFQQMLSDRPDAGVLIRGGHGLRKVRWALPGCGKSGGLRVIYYWRIAE